jgi:hypothetical protein
MPSLLPVLCNLPRAQMDALGREDSARGKHCANYVNVQRKIKMLLVAPGQFF